MELEKARQEYNKACIRNDLARLKYIVTNYEGNDLDPNPENSEILESAFYSARIDVINYLLNSKEVKQDMKIPEPIFKTIRLMDNSVIEYLCTNKEIKPKFNVLENKEHFKIGLNAACKINNTTIIKDLVLAPETKNFWEEKLSVLYYLVEKNDPKIDFFKTVLENIVNSVEDKTDRNKSLINMYLEDCLYLSVKNNNMDLATYLIFDLNIKVEDYNRDIIKTDFPNGEKLLILRDINKEFENSDNQKKKNKEKIKHKKIKF
jgi:hypothetical protein